MANRNSIVAQSLPWMAPHQVSHPMQPQGLVSSAPAILSALTGRQSRYTDPRTAGLYKEARAPGTTPGMQLVEEQGTYSLPVGVIYETAVFDKELAQKRSANIREAANASSNAERDRVIGMELDSQGDALGGRIGDSMYQPREPSLLNSHLHAISELPNKAFVRFNGFRIPEGCTDLRQVVKWVGLLGTNKLYSDTGAGADQTVAGRLPAVNNGLTTWQIGDAICDELPNVDAEIRKFEHDRQSYSSNYPPNSWAPVREVFNPRRVTDFGTLAVIEHFRAIRSGGRPAALARDLTLLAPGAEGRLKAALSLEQEYMLRMRHFITSVAVITLELQRRGAGGDATYALPPTQSGREIFDLFFEKRTPTGQPWSPDAFMDRLVGTAMSGLLDTTMQQEFDPAKLFGATALAANGLPSQVVRTRADVFANADITIRESAQLVQEAFSVATMDNNSRRIGISTTHTEGGANVLGSILIC